MIKSLLDSDKPKKNYRFYTEMVVATIVSLVAASVWIEFTKGAIYTLFPNNKYTAFLVFAIILTFIAIYSLHMLFSDD